MNYLINVKSAHGRKKTMRKLLMLLCFSFVVFAMGHQAFAADFLSSNVIHASIDEVRAKEQSVNYFCGFLVLSCSSTVGSPCVGALATLFALPSRLFLSFGNVGDSTLLSPTTPSPSSFHEFVPTSSTNSAKDSPPNSSKSSQTNDAQSDSISTHHEDNDAP